MSRLPQLFCVVGTAARAWLSVGYGNWTRSQWLRTMLAALGVACLCAAGARAQSTLTVHTLSDSDDGSCTSTTSSLGDAITQAIADNYDDPIRFSVTGTNTLSSTLPTITRNVTITGPGANGQFRRGIAPAPTGFMADER